MANIKSQIKRNRQNEKRNERSRAVRSELKTRAKSAVQAAEAGESDRAEDLLRVAQQRLDKAVAGGVIHRNTAARRKARLTRQVRSLLA